MVAPPRSSAHAALGQAIRDLRGPMAISQEALGDLTGLHRTYVGDVERGERNPSYTSILKLAAALGVRASELIAHAERLEAPRSSSQRLTRRSIRANGDGEGVCEVLAVEAEREFEGPGCPEVIEQDFTSSLSEEGKESFRNAKVSIEQDGDSARAASTLIDGNILLERRDGEWLITDLSDAN